MFAERMGSDWGYLKSNPPNHEMRFGAMSFPKNLPFLSIQKSELNPSQGDELHICYHPTSTTCQVWNKSPIGKVFPAARELRCCFLVGGHEVKRFGLAFLPRKQDMDVSKNRGTPKSSILIGFSIMNHPFWGTPFLETPM